MDTPLHAFRMAEERWDRFGRATAALHTDRSKVLNALVEAWLTGAITVDIPDARSPVVLHGDLGADG